MRQMIIITASTSLCSSCIISTAEAFFHFTSFALSGQKSVLYIPNFMRPDETPRFLSLPACMHLQVGTPLPTGG
ncbi:hypothetical protein M432DRAFT_621835 [Thermoascus aurantiacus ATCC 26904]